jgi:uncharacterized membrane protein (UPF0182 family)
VETIDWPPARAQRPRGPLFIFGVLAALALFLGTALSYYVESLWFDSLGFSSIFWTTLNTQGIVFAAFFVVTFLALYGSFLLLKPARISALTSPILINGQPLRLPVEPVLRLIGLAAALLIAGVTGLGMMAQWPTLALYWYGSDVAPGPDVDPIFGRPITFYLFTLPAWHLLASWITTLAVIVCAAAIFFAVVVGGARLLARGSGSQNGAFRGVSLALAVVLVAIAARVYLGRFDRILADHTIFSGVTYTDAHVGIPGMLWMSGALLLGAALLLVNAVVAPRLRWIIAAPVPAAAVYVVVGVIGWYVNGFVVKPNELVRETPYITHNIAGTRAAFGLTRVQQVAFPAAPGIQSLDADNNSETLENIRLWDWRALQDTLRQIQEIRTYYDFPDIDIDRYELDGKMRQMMLAVRELNVERLPDSSRNWINEKLVYTHGYGITMNTVNGFTPEGMPDLLLGNMPIQSKHPTLKVTRPEIYFGELTNTDVYVKTNAQEFNYPEGDTNSVTRYEGTGGILIGGFLRRLIIALDRGDLTRMPFSDDVTSESRLLMHRNIGERVRKLAPFLTFDPDSYIVVTSEGRLVWMLDGFTTSDLYPYARHYRLGNRRLNYMRNSIKATVDAYDGTVAFYVFDPQDPITAAYRVVFPDLFKDMSEMPADLRRHVRYPELLLEMQAAVYGLYHMTSPEMFYNREDLWTVASVAGSTDRREQAAQAVEPNFVLMKLPGEERIEFIEILPFTPANRNNLIGWIAGRSDDPNYGAAIVYNFPEERLVDGPLQIDARIDQNAQLSAQLSLWNQQGSTVRRGSLIVLPVGRGLLYAEPIYLQAVRSPMPELRIVVLALQDRLAYGPTFEAALAALFGRQPSTLAAPLPSTSERLPDDRPPAPPTPGAPPPAAPVASQDVDSLISEAARDLAAYQRLTAEGRLGEAGQRLEGLKQKLDELQRRSR